MSSKTSSSAEPTEPTQGKKLQDFYGSETAAMYAGMMESEMVKYKEDFELIFKTLEEEFSPKVRVLDTCVGSGHMLQYIGELFGKEDRQADLTGLDLSPDMIQVAQPLIPQATLRVGNMLDIRTSTNQISDASYNLILNNFAMHHASADQAAKAIQDYAGMLAPKGCLFFSAWEGKGKIDYGEEMDMDANFHSEADMKAWVQGKAGLRILKCRSFVEVEMGNMNSVYIIAQKEVKED